MRTSTFYLIVFLIMLAQMDGQAQLGISGSPHPSAVLDLKSPNNDKAFYPPRLSSAQRLAISNPQAGALVYDLDKGTLYLHNGQNWLPLAFTDLSRTASDGEANDEFGASVAISGDYALVGAPNKIIGSNGAKGAVYVFVRSGSSWNQQQRLTPSDGAAEDYFGNSVALSGEYALVGSGGKTIDGNERQGAVYVFARSGSNWNQQQRLTASDGAARDNFGGRVALYGEYALVSAPDKTISGNANQGAVYVFVRSGSNWSQQQQLTASDGAAEDNFGNSVDLSGPYALVGSISKDVGSNINQGAAYVFFRSGSSWSQQQRLIASDGASGDQFGASVSIWGGYALVGAPLKNIDGKTFQGAAYVFMQSGSSWSQQQRLVASDGAVGDFFGSSVALWWGYALVGAPNKTIGGKSQQGAAYVFMQSGSSWSQQQRLTDDSTVDTHLGVSVVLSNGTYLIGGPGYQRSQGKVIFGPVN